MPTPNHTITAVPGDGGQMEVVFHGNDIGSTWNVNGGAGSYIIVEEYEADEFIEVTPTQLALRNVTSPYAILINYTEIERLTIVGTGHAPNGDRVYWTTGDTIDDITVTGTRGELPIDIWSGGGNDEIRLDGPVGGGSRVNAGDGNDFVYGSSGADILWGGAGEDTLEGGEGNDILVGGGARDMLFGGAGADIFRYESAQDSGGPGGIDTIGGFVRGVDKIDLRGAGGYQWIGGAPFSGRAGEIRGTMLGIQVDVNGDKTIDMIVWVNGGNGGGLRMTADDFIL